MAHEKFEMVEMEGRLAADDDGSYRDQICSELKEHWDSLRREMDAGLATEEFERASKLRDALEAADSAVRILWRMAHGGGPR